MPSGSVKELAVVPEVAMELLVASNVPETWILGLEKEVATPFSMMADFFQLMYIGLSVLLVTAM